MCAEWRRWTARDVCPYDDDDDLDEAMQMMTSADGNGDGGGDHLRDITQHPNMINPSQ